MKNGYRVIDIDTHVNPKSPPYRNLREPGHHLVGSPPHRLDRAHPRIRQLIAKTGLISCRPEALEQDGAGTLDFRATRSTRP